MARKLIINGQIHLYGYVGAPEDVAEGFTPSEVAQALAELGPGDVAVRLNSGGGIAFDGMTIYSLLAAHPGKITIAVDGVAASAASLLAMSGDVIEMREGAMMMIHDPRGVAFGPASEMVAAAESLNKLADNYAAVYAKRAGKEIKPVRDMMLATTWFSAADAVKEGFASAMVEAKSVAMAQFDYEQYGAVPEPLRASIKKPPAAIAKMAPALIAAARLRMDALAAL